MAGQRQDSRISAQESQSRRPWQTKERIQGIHFLVFILQPKEQRIHYSSHVQAKRTKNPPPSSHVIAKRMRHDEPSCTPGYDWVSQRTTAPLPLPLLPPAICSLMISIYIYCDDGEVSAKLLNRSKCRMVVCLEEWNRVLFSYCVIFL